LAAAHRRAARPVLRGGAQLDVHGVIGGALERLARLAAISQSPGGEPGGPFALRDPRAGARLRDRLRQGERGEVLILDIIAPGDARAPFGARSGAESGIDPVEE